MKGDTKKSIILKIVVLLAIVIFFAGAWLLLKFYVVDPAVNSSDMDDIRAIFYSTPEDVTEETLIQEITNEQGSVVETIVVPVENENKATKTKNWKAVKKVNKEIVAWVKLNKTDIDYPVLFHKEDTEDSQFYLYRNYKKEYSDFGSIFLDYRCTGMADSKHVILHGHNMGSDKDAMFGSLINYTRKSGATKANTDYYKSHAIINYDTPKQNGEWIIFAAMKINVSNDKEIFNYLQTTFDNDAQFMNFIYNIKERSYLDVNVPINETDRILTLSTCSYETDNMRTIIVARKVRDGEDVSKYIKGVKAQTPVSSVSSDFISEFKNIKWYDGTKKPAGDGELKPMEKMETYTVIYYDAYGKVAHKEIVKAGDKAKGYPGAPPEKKKDQKNYYNFVEWKPDPTKIKITKDLKVYPVYRASKIVEGATDATAPGYVPMTQPSVAPKPTKPTTTNPKPTKPTKPTPSTGDET